MYLVYSDEDFTPFVAAVLKKPGSKVTIKLLMDYPARSARRKQAEQSQDNSLAMSYAPNDERLALHRLQTESLHIKDPANPACSMRFTRDGLYVWSRALVHKAKGVTNKIPPVTKEFMLEPITIYTQAEKSALANRRGGKAQSARPAGLSSLDTPQFTAPRVMPGGRIRPPRLITSPPAHVSPGPSTPAGIKSKAHK
ncbi:hypothetical protein PGTUg99_023832 [Puccinia graminis f. sp. tritici]|nr:hypothetical protein PGTUg99_023832 [Puccinia graminis f. sp. tritici]